MPSNCVLVIPGASRSSSATSFLGLLSLLAGRFRGLPGMRSQFNTNLTEYDCDLRSCHRPMPMFQAVVPVAAASLGIRKCP